MDKRAHEFGVSSTVDEVHRNQLFARAQGGQAVHQTQLGELADQPGHRQGGCGGEDQGRVLSFCNTG